MALELINQIQCVLCLGVSEETFLSAIEDKPSVRICVTVSCDNDESDILELSDLKFQPFMMHYVDHVLDSLEEVFDRFHLVHRALLVDCAHSNPLAELLRNHEWAEFDDSYFMYGDLKSDEIKASKTPSVLHLATRMGEHELIAHFIQNGTVVDAFDRHDETALMLACKHGRELCVRKLIENRADVNISKPDGVTALIYATQGGHNICVRELVNAGVNLDAVNQLSLTALMITCQSIEKSSIRVASELIIGNADVNKASKDGKTAIMFASQNANIELVEMLIDAGANVNASAQNSTTALIISCSSFGKPCFANNLNYIKIAQRLISANADVNKALYGGTTAIMTAAYNSRVEIVRMLIEAGANVNAKQDTGTTVLMQACSSSCDNEECVEELLRANVDVNAANSFCQTALSLAIDNSRLGAVRLLLQNGALISLVDFRKFVNMKSVDGDSKEHKDFIEEMIVLATCSLVRKRVRRAETDSERLVVRRMIETIERHNTDAILELNDAEFSPPGGSGYLRILSEWKKHHS